MANINVCCLHTDTDQKQHALIQIPLRGTKIKRHEKSMQSYPACKVLKNKLLMADNNSYLVYHRTQQSVTSGTWAVC